MMMDKVFCNDIAERSNAGRETKYISRIFITVKTRNASSLMRRVSVISLSPGSQHTPLLGTKQ